MGGTTFGILTSGGDCPGLNAAIRGVAKAAYHHSSDQTIYGVAEGFRGFIEGNVRLMEQQDFDGILTLGGTILGTSREKPFGENERESDKRTEIRQRSANRSSRFFRFFSLGESAG